MIVNPVAGRGKTRRKIPVLKEVLSTVKNARFDLFLTEYPEHATEITLEKSNQYDAVLAMGGDGTVNEIVRGCLETEAIIGVIPEGRGNDFARSISFSENIRDSINKILEYQVESVDVGQINDHYFINGVGIGFDGYVNQRNLTRKYLKGAFSYYYTLLESLILWQPIPVKISIDDKVRKSAPLFLTAIGNGKFCGGGLKLNPNAEIDDGKLDVCLVKEIDKLKIIRNLKRLKDGSINKLEEVEIIRGENIQITSSEKLPIHYDGELLNYSGQELNINLLKSAVKVIYS